MSGAGAGSEILAVLARIEAKVDALAAARAAAPTAAGGPVFPPYGRSKGLPVEGAPEGDLRFYASGCRRSLADPAKSRFHAKESALLTAIEAEMTKRGLAVEPRPEVAKTDEQLDDEAGGPPPF